MVLLRDYVFVGVFSCWCERVVVVVQIEVLELCLPRLEGYVATLLGGN